MLLDSKYMAAVSGGPDSMAMLDTYRNQIDCVVHINYNLRPTAARDEKIVRAYCAKHNLSYKILNVSDIIHAYYNLKFPNQEEALRELRYDYFDHISKITNNNRVLTGHNLNDYVETAIMQYNSNRHEYGFLGMRSITNHHNVTIIRPFLFIPKNDLIDYCNRRILEFGYDETNADPKFKRNAIRQQIQNWSMRLFIFAKIITKINRKKNRFNNTVDRYFRGWQRNEYDIERFRNFPKKYHSSIIYHFLNSLNVDVSANKINGLIEFIFNSDGNDKEYRLSDNVGIRFGR